jgi:uncharacterized protein YbcC (UPF0753/DUF2309 family)
MNKYSLDSILQQYVFLFKYFEKIKSFDIKNFNTLLFKDDILNLTEDEFDEIYDVVIDEILENNIFNFELLLEPDQTSFTKQDFIDFIEFYMHTLPYNYLKNILAKYNSIPEFYEYLMSPDTDIKEQLKNEAIKSIDTNDKFNDLVKNLGANITSAKNKEKYESIVGLLDKSIIKKKNIFKKHADMILDVSLSDLQNLITIYINNDLSNLKG